MRYLLLGVVVGLLALVSGCSTPNSAVMGYLYTSKVQGSVGGVDNAVMQKKAGRATARGIFGFASGDASIRAAMKNGNITKVHHIDSESTSVLGIWSTYTTVVHGD